MRHNATQCDTFQPALRESVAAAVRKAKLDGWMDEKKPKLDYYAPPPVPLSRRAGDLFAFLLIAGFALAFYGILAMDLLPSFMPTMPLIDGILALGAALCTWFAIAASLDFFKR
jgi:hypothetical protein